MSSFAAPSRLLFEIDVSERLPVSRTMKQASVSSADQGGGKRCSNLWYGWVRGLGSLAFILGSLAVGQSIQAFGIDSIVIGQAILLLTAAAAAFWVPEISLPRSGGLPASPEDRQVEPTIRELDE